MLIPLEVNGIDLGHSISVYKIRPLRRKLTGTTLFAPALFIFVEVEPDNIMRIRGNTSAANDTFYILQNAKSGRHIIPQKWESART